MKRVLLLIIFISLELFGQRVTVVEDVPITNFREGRFYYPVLSPDGAQLFFSSVNYKGLWYKNLTTGKLEIVTNQLGAGYGVSFKGNNIVLFRENKFINGKSYSNLKSFDLVSKKSVDIEKEVRDLHVYKSFDNQSNFYFRNGEIIPFAQNQSLQKGNANDIIVYSENSQIVISTNNQKKVIEPLGKGHYLWLSLSPDKTKLLFTFAGKGTYVTDLNGKILNKVGYANYPSWSQDGNWVLFMKDIDDGINVISSNIQIANLKTGKYFNLTTGRKDIPLYPQWGSSINEIFYNTDGGQIRKIKLKID